MQVLSLLFAAIGTRHITFRGGSARLFTEQALKDEGQMKGRQQEHGGSLKNSEACKVMVGRESNPKNDLLAEIKDPTFQT